MQTVSVRLAGPGDRISDSDFGRMAWKGRWRGRRDSEYEGDGTSKHHNFTCNSDKKSYQSLHLDREPESRGRLRPPPRQLSLVVMVMVPVQCRAHRNSGRYDSDIL